MLAANFAVAGGLLTGEAHACSCAPSPGPKEELRTSEAVFWDEAVNVETQRSFAEDMGPVTFDVKQSWKGELQDSAVVYGQGSGMICGLNFEEGKSYLVYAYDSGTGEDGSLETNLCTSTSPLSDVEAAPKEIGPPTGELPDTGGPGWSLLSVIAAFGALAFAFAFSAGVIAMRRKS